MTTGKKHMARIMFQNKLLSSDKQAYEDLFTKVMQSNDRNFQPVKPHGREGDRKCDGFNKMTGKYYQVYAPEDVSGKDKTAQKKLDDTIDGLFSYWSSISPIKEFYFVINDKYKGAWPEIHKQLADIEKRFKVQTNTFLCKDLEDIFLELQDSQITNILGGLLPDVESIGDIDISVLGEVINHLMHFETKPVEERFPEDPDFDKKIIFNRLSDEYGMLLKVSYRQIYMIDDYFTYQSSFTKQDLKLVFSDFYDEAAKTVSEAMENRNDIIFQKIWDAASPKNTKSSKDAALVLMAYYFESCDIFEEPVVPRQQNLFE